MKDIALMFALIAKAIAQANVFLFHPVSAFLISLFPVHQFQDRLREFAVEEALFKGWLGFMDKWDKSSFQIDEILINNLRH